MLKPRKRNTQKEIRRDPFLETIDSAQAHIEHNKTLYTQIITGVLVIIAGFLFLSNKNKLHLREGNIAFGNALIALDQTDLSNAKFQLETVYNDYSDTKPALQASYFLGKIYFEEGNFDLAEKYIREYFEKSDNEMLLVPSIKILLDIELQRENFKNAISIINNSKRRVLSPSHINSLNLDEIRLLIVSGSIDKAREKLDIVLNVKDLPNNQKQLAEQFLGQISS